MANKRINDIIDDIAKSEGNASEKTRALCSRIVRKCKCANCLHCKECEAKGTSVSNRAQELSKIAFSYLPRLRRYLCGNYFSQNLKILLNSPVSPLFTGAVCSIKLSVIKDKEYYAIGRFNVYEGTHFETIKLVATNLCEKYIEREWGLK